MVELYGLYERTDHLYRVYQKSSTNPALLRAATWWDENVTSMLTRALGDRTCDEEAMIDHEPPGTIDLSPSEFEWSISQTSRYYMTGLYHSSSQTRLSA